MARRKRVARGGKLRGYVLEHGRAIVIMAAAASAAGLAYNVLYSRGIFAPPPPVVSLAPESACAQRKAPEPQVEAPPKNGVGDRAPVKEPAVPDVSLEQAKAQYDAHTALFVDARSREAYARGHIVGAISLPAEGIGSGVPSLPGGKDATVVVYCVSADCDEAGIVSKALAVNGYRNVLLFKDGWNSWDDAGYPQEKSNP